MSHEADQLRVEVIKLREQLSGERGLWHCTLEDKAAMDAHLLAVERERDRLRGLCRAEREAGERLAAELANCRRVGGNVFADARKLADERDRLRGALQRAVYLAEHLFQMVPREVWRDSGADDGQGHYEGEYRAERLREELAALAGPLPEEPKEG